MTSLVDMRELERQVAEQEAVLNELVSQVDSARARLGALYSLRHTIALLDSPDSSTATRSDPSDWPVVVPSGAVVIPGREPSKKIRSTKMVADIVNSASRSVSREEVHDEFRRVHGNPGNWSSPANALNNALARAVEKGLISLLPDGTYAPAGTRPDSGQGSDA